MEKKGRDGKREKGEATNGRVLCRCPTRNGSLAALLNQWHEKFHNKNSDS